MIVEDNLFPPKFLYANNFVTECRHYFYRAVLDFDFLKIKVHSPGIAFASASLADRKNGLRDF